MLQQTICLVLTCGRPIPTVPNTTFSPPPTPWYPGLPITYRCDRDGYVLQDSDNGRSVCTVNTASHEAEWSQPTNARCVPGKNQFSFLFRNFVVGDVCIALTTVRHKIICRSVRLIT